MADNSKTETLIILAGAAIGLWYLYEEGYLYSWTGIAALYPGTLPTTTPTTTSTTTTSAPSTTTTSTGTTTPTQPLTLTAQDAAQVPYSSSITAAEMDSIQSTLDQELSSGSIPQILGTSVLAYMLGWGGGTSGETQSTSGYTYKFDGTNWNLTGPSSGVSGRSIGGLVPAWGIHGMGFARLRRGMVH
jgi:hypothetical protein